MRLKLHFINLGCLSIFGHKLKSRALKCAIIGYGSTKKKRYKCYHPETRRFFITMDVIFDESKFYYSFINLKPTFPEDVRQLTIHNDVLCFDIKSMILPNNGSSDENTSSTDTFMDTPTTVDPCSQDSNYHCDNFFPESSPTLQVQPENSP